MNFLKKFCNICFSFFFLLKKKESVSRIWASVSWFALKRMPLQEAKRQHLCPDPSFAHALMAGINLRNDLVGRHHQDAIIWPTMISFLRPAIFPEVINLGHQHQLSHMWLAKRPLERHSSSTDITFPIITIPNSFSFSKEKRNREGNVLWKIECFLED